MAKNEFHERLINLTFAFLYANDTGRRYITAEWIRTNVAGYQDRTDAAFQRMFARDRSILAKVGVPIETIAQATLDDAPGYRLNPHNYYLPEVSFTPGEAAVLALAGDKGLNHELAAFARSGWTKLAAAGASTVTAQDSAPVMFNNVTDLGVLTAQSLDTILKAHRNHHRIHFDYTPHKNAEPTRRVMDPWGIVNHQDRWYLVGFDIERDAPRTFRITRVSNIDIVGRAMHPAPEHTPLQELVADSLRSRKVLIDATITAEPGTAGELTSRASHRDHDTYVLTGVDRDWLVRTAAAYAPHALVVEPADVRDDVIAQLRSLLEVTPRDC